MKQTERDISLAEKKRVLLKRLLHQDGIDVSASAPIPRRSGQEAVPVSSAQQRLWFLDQLVPGSAFYNTPAVIPLKFAVNVPVLERSLNEIVRRHEALRTTFAPKDGQPIQVIAPVLSLPVPVLDLAHFPPGEREREALRVVSEETQRPFDLRQGPLLRTTLLRLGYEDYVFVLTAHHSVFDGWSMRVFFNELTSLYAAYFAGQPSPLPELPVQYGDYAVWQRQLLRGEVLAKELEYWKRQLASLPVLQLPTDRARPAMASFRGAYHLFDLPTGLVERLRLRAQGEEVTLFMILYATFATLLHRFTGQDDVVVGTPVAGRSRAELERLIGFFVNTLVLRTSFQGDPTFRELLRRVREVTLGAYSHQELPFEILVEKLQPERDLSRNPLFQVSFQLFNPAGTTRGTTTAGQAPPEIQRQTAVFDLTFNLWEHDRGIAGQIEYSSDLFDASTIERMYRVFTVLIDATVEDPDRRISELPLVTAEERKRLLVDWNNTRTDYPRDTCAHTLFEGQAERTPEAVALVCGEQIVTYGDLNGRATQLAHYLQALGVGPDVLVGLCANRSIDMVVGLLGILKAGGAYVPLDPCYPRGRLHFMLEDTGAPVVLTQEALFGRLPQQNLQLICLDRDWAEIARAPEPKRLQGATATNLAYAIYTSGSTGTPKGILIPHRGLVNYLCWCTGAYNVSAGCGAPVHSSLAFDLTITGLLAPLMVGAAVYLVPEDDGVEALGAVLRQTRDFSLVKITPAHLLLLSQQLPAHEAAGRTRAFVIGGQDLRAESTLFWQENAPTTTLVNEYGPSETVVGCCVYSIPQGQHGTGSIPIGRPIANTELYVLDRFRQPVPIGIPGELYIGGDGLARGYLNRPELTQEKFVVHSFRSDPGARLYRTGDLVRYRPDGNLEFLGRIDDQVKLRGFRIELGEIQMVLQEHPAIREAVVLLRPDTPGEPRLVAYFVTPESALSATDLRRFLQEKLPEYMLPALFIRIDSLPLTANGKVDRGALPAPGLDRPALETAYATPRTPMEERLARLWAELLRLEKVGIHDNFFTDLGGHSLLATQLVSRLRTTLGVDVPLRRIFEVPTVAGLAQTIAVETPDGQLRPEDPGAIRRRGRPEVADPSNLSDQEVSVLLAEMFAKEEERR